nr:MAG TPA: hypothetical protein [Caudoviricetes sp.]
MMILKNGNFTKILMRLFLVVIQFHNTLLFI